MRPWTKVRSDLAHAGKAGADEKTLEALRAELRASRLAAAITKAVDEFPPLTSEQRSDLARLLTGGAQ